MAKQEQPAEQPTAKVKTVKMVCERDPGDRRPTEADVHPDEVENMQAAAWLPGSEGQGVADVLFGDKPFVGVLPIIWDL